MTYLTKEEFDKLGFEVEGDFDKLLKRAELAIDAYIRDFYSLNSFVDDNTARKKAVKLATAFQFWHHDGRGQAIHCQHVSRTDIYKLSLRFSEWLKFAFFSRKV